MKMLRRLMISCIKSTELMEKRILFGLSFGEKLKLLFHKSMCDACTQYEKQSRMIEKYLHKHVHSENKNDAHASENKSLKDKIKSRL